MLQAIKYQDREKVLTLLDQLQLPLNVSYLSIKSCDDAWAAIHKMQVRGAPAIAIVALLSIGLELAHRLDGQQEVQDLDNQERKAKLHRFVGQRSVYLCSARPTAVNVRKETEALKERSATLLTDGNKTEEDMRAELVVFIEQCLAQDLAVNKSIGEHGARHIIAENTGRESGLTILTHCNTGSLATSGYGTALGCIRSLHTMGYLEKVFCTETRPYNQGARLTAWELVQEKIDGTLICDNMVAALMRKQKVDAVIVGADRVVSNGDTANKIGTYQIAVLAKHHDVPFYVASPLSTIDMSLENGSQIPIEERPHNEMKFVGETQIAPTEINCWNPAFDVTPASLISGIVTEVGVFNPSQLSLIKELQ